MLLFIAHNQDSERKYANYPMRRTSQAPCNIITIADSNYIDAKNDDNVIINCLYIDNINRKASS